VVKAANGSSSPSELSCSRPASVSVTSFRPPATVTRTSPSSSSWAMVG
jgi:hypothetical protein